MTIRARLSFTFVLCLLLACASIGMLVFTDMQKNTERMMHTLANNQLDRIEERISSFMVPAIMSVRYLAVLNEVAESRGRLTSYLDTTEDTVISLDNYTEHEKRIYGEFIRTYRSNSNFDLVFMANDDGQYMQAPAIRFKEAGYDPRERSWYREMVASSKIIALSSPYMTTGGQAVCSVMARTRDKNGRPLGMVGIDFLLDELTEDLQVHRVLETGYIVLADARGIIFVDGNRAQNVGKKLQDTSNLWSAPELSGDKGSLIGKNSKGEGKFVVAKTMADTGWKVAIVFDQDEMLAPSWDILRQIAIGTLVIACLFGLVAIELAHGIVRPMEELVEVSDEISGGQFSNPTRLRARLERILAIRGTREVDRLARSLRDTMLTMQARVEEAIAASKAKSSFLANMSHEIRTPMNGIVGLIHLLRGTALDDRQKDYVAKLSRSAHTLLGIINDILDFSKIEAGKVAMERIPFTVDVVLDDVGMFFAERSRESGVALVIEKPDMEHAPLVGDPTRLGQVLINLVGNAFKFTPKGSITVSVAPWDGAPAGECGLRFSVRDTGIGMSKAQLEKVFSPFEQADSSITRRYGGTGLGLSICKSLVGLMGGEISATSTEGQGTTIAFTASFGQGAAPDATTADSAAGEDAAPDFAGMRVLLAEDNDINTMIATELLEQVGVAVTCVGNGKQALDVLAAAKGGPCPFHLVLMDMQMPEMDGLEATRQIRAMPEYAGLPIVALTANVFAEERANCLASGMDDYLGKPLELPALYAVLQRYSGLLSARSSGASRS